MPGPQHRLCPIPTQHGRRGCCRPRGREQQTPGSLSACRSSPERIPGTRKGNCPRFWGWTLHWSQCLLDSAPLPGNPSPCSPEAWEGSVIHTGRVSLLCPPPPPGSPPSPAADTRHSSSQTRVFCCLPAQQDQSLLCIHPTSLQSCKSPLPLRIS